LEKGFEAPGERWNVAIKSSYVGGFIGLFLVKKVTIMFSGKQYSVPTNPS
jgi:hypothetical protein